MYKPIMGSQNKILGLGVASYPTYLSPLVPLFGISSLWRPATSVKTNGYLRKLNRWCAWIFSIDWYLNWPHSNFIPWDLVHEQVLGGLHLGGGIVKKIIIFFTNFFLAFWVNRSFRKRFRQKKIKVRYSCFSKQFSNWFHFKILFNFIYFCYLSSL